MEILGRGNRESRDTAENNFLLKRHLRFSQSFSLHSYLLLKRSGYQRDILKAFWHVAVSKAFWVFLTNIRERRQDTTVHSLRPYHSLGNTAPVLKSFSPSVKPFIMLEGILSSDCI